MTSIKSFVQLPELKLLYLHGNSIANIKGKYMLWMSFDKLSNLEVNNLKCLTNLNSLTLHGNPLEQKHNYRKHILSVLPQDWFIWAFKGAIAHLYIAHSFKYSLKFGKPYDQLIKFDFSLVTKAEKREIAPPFVTPNYTVPKWNYIDCNTWWNREFRMHFIKWMNGLCSAVLNIRPKEVELHPQITVRSKCWTFSDSACSLRCRRLRE